MTNGLGGTHHRIRETGGLPAPYHETGPESSATGHSLYRIESGPPTVIPAALSSFPRRRESRGVDGRPGKPAGTLTIHPMYRITDCHTFVIPAEVHPVSAQGGPVCRGGRPGRTRCP